MLLGWIIKNEYIKSFGVSNIVGKMRDNSLKWFGNVERINNEDIV